MVLAAACGKKGPPLAPLNMAPEPPQGVSVRRVGDTMYLHLTVPKKSAVGDAPASVAYLEVYAVTLGAGDFLPPNRDLLKPEFVVAKIAVRKPPDPDAEPVEGEAAAGPLPGDAITFVETITPALLEPQQVSKPVVAPPARTPSASAPPASAPAAAAAAASAPVGVAVLTRLYSVRGVAANGAKGPTSARAAVPLLAAPGPPRAGTTSFDQSSVTVTWQPPVSASDEAPGVTYNIYPYAPPAAGSGTAATPPAAPQPLNAAPLDVTSSTQPGAVPGKEQCFVVRSVATVGTATIEGEPSEPMCVTPADTFPPAAPTGLAAVSGPGVINLIWDANKETDLAGYVVLRGEAPGDTLQPLTPQPIRETRYVDRAVQPGVTYVYAVVALDTAPAPNRSALSNKVQETAR